MTTLLQLTLSLAVPLWIDEVRAWSIERRLERVKICGQVVAERGDIIQFKSKKKNETAEAFNRLAEGLAIMAFRPGGVTFMDLHFEVLEEPAACAEVVSAQRRLDRETDE